ncbi:MAG: histidine kinase [Micropruina sp.]|uniref:sensor histidine kinase n=1 Tax=Micropruina sp. TaxID=2737536 RepID=UPI0039E55D83
MLLNGALDVVLAALVAAPSVLIGVTFGQPLAIVVDLAACLAAALTIRWPRAAGAALGAVLLVYLASPPDWAETGEYAALIPILGTGIRSQRRERIGLSLGYWLILAVRQVVGYPGDPVRGVLSSLVWAALFAVMWLMGSAIAAINSAQEQARIAALAQQRLVLARELHDTVARSLARLSRQAHRAADTQDASQLGPIADGIGHAAGQLRWLLGALRDSDQTTLSSTGSLTTTVRECLEGLQAHGFQVSTAIDGDLDAIPLRTGGVLADIVKEATANIERHGASNRPCALVASIDETSADLAFINEVATANGQPAATTPLGLLGAAERLALVGGQLEARQEGSQWITRVTIPITPQS